MPFKLTKSIVDGAVPPPVPDAFIWRYMNLPKFISLLQQRSLYFSRVAQLDDPFEGSFPCGQTNWRRLIEIWRPDELTEGLSDEASEAIRLFYARLREWSAVSCWHCAPQESAAMWSLYGSIGDAIAIQSTPSALQKSLGPASPPPGGVDGLPGYLFGMVKYIDYSVDTIPGRVWAAQFFRKRKSFAHEQELRVLLVRYPTVQTDGGAELDFDREAPTEGMSIPVKLNQLVHEVRIAPQAPAWYAELVIKLASKYRLRAVPSQSELDAVPFF